MWNQGQDRSLLMNTVASDVTVFTDDSVPCEGPIIPGPTQYQWSRLVNEGKVDDVSDEARAEVDGMLPWTYGSRALNGAYLSWALGHILRSAPPELSVEIHRTRAVSLADAGDGTQQLWLEDSDQPLTVDAVVLAQGTSTWRPPRASRSWPASRRSTGSPTCRRPARPRPTCPPFPRRAGGPARPGPQLLRLRDAAHHRPRRPVRARRRRPAALPALGPGAGAVRRIRARPALHRPGRGAPGGRPALPAALPDRRGDCPAAAERRARRDRLQARPVALRGQGGRLRLLPQPAQ
ncbi:FAD/NAD(P)-binding protein [Streptacidiphilus sp. 4-A2]|nr:FAD/NAD(P)-binding protein [Streptacidiphilus sp. 4-A2]